MVRRAALLAVLLSVMLAAPAAARPAITIVGEQPSDLAGASVAGAGDVNGDGRDDAIVGAPLADAAGRLDAGAAYVVFGGGPRGRVALGAPGERGFRIDGAVPLGPGMQHAGSGPLTSGAGAVVAGLGDVNGDGLADVAVSGRKPGAFGGAETVVFVVFGKGDGTPVDLAALVARGGFVVRSAGDGARSSTTAGPPATSTATASPTSSSAPPSRATRTPVRSTSSAAARRRIR